MRTDEIFETVLHNHGTNWKRYAEDVHGLPKNYYVQRLRQREYITADAYTRYIMDFGCEVIAKRGNETRSLTETLLMPQSGTRLHDIIEVLKALSFSLYVKDGDNEYELTSARIVEKGKSMDGNITEDYK